MLLSMYLFRGQCVRLGSAEVLHVAVFLPVLFLPGDQLNSCVICSVCPAVGTKTITGVKIKSTPVFLRGLF